MPGLRVDPASFDAIYTAARDPWAFATSTYERNRYDTTIASLSKAGYQRCFEPACSIGVLTSRLALLADEVVACDASAVAVERARARLSHARHVRLVNRSIPEWWPEGSFDLIVLSELGYYWDRHGWADIIQRCRDSLRSRGELIAVHWLGSSDGHILHGWTVHHELTRLLGTPDLRQEHPVDPDGAASSDAFVLDRWTELW